jgi:predicted methyltransferase
MRHFVLLPLLIATAPLATAPLAAAPAPLANVAAAVSAPSRTADNVKLDASRKPAEVLKWAGLRRGMDVLDLFGGNLYWSEIMAPSVGASGHVTAWEAAQFSSDDARKAFAAFKSRQPNVDLIESPMEAPMLPANRFDFAMFNLDYHDIYWQSDKYKVSRMEPQAWLKSLNRAMKRGATVVVIDHVGPAGDTRAIVEKMHRIDPAVVRADFRKAGFALVATSPLLRNPNDAHDVLVFDPKIQGKTDRFVYKFRKVR